MTRLTCRYDGEHWRHEKALSMKWSTALALKTVLVAASFITPALSLAQGVPINGTNCVNAFNSRGSVCTAKDVTSSPVLVSGPEACERGETFTATLQFSVISTAKERDNLGFFIGELGQNALGGSQCTFSSLANIGSPVNLASGVGPYREINGDSCGDLAKREVTLHNVVATDLLCDDQNGDGRVDISYLISWEKNKNNSCVSPTDIPSFFPDQSSACVNENGEGIDVPIEDPPVIEVEKRADPEQLEAPGGEVIYRVIVSNQSDPTDPVTITSLTDSAYGDVTALAQTTCELGVTVAPGGQYQCEFLVTHTGVAGDTFPNTLTAQAVDNEGSTASASDNALVTIVPEPLLPSITIEKTGSPSQIAEPGGDVTYGIRVVNTGNTDLVLSALDDDRVGGSLNGVGDCATGGTLAVGASYSCSYIQAVNGSFGDPAVVNTVTATATVPADPDTTLTESDSFAVTILADPEPPSILVTKNVSPEELEEPGGAVVYTIRVTNTSQGTDPVTLTSLVDTVYGDLNGQGSCATGGVIASGATYECTLNESHTGVAGDTFANTVTAQAQDDEGETAQDSDDALVTILAEPLDPELTIEKTGTPGQVTEPGGDVTYGIRVVNTGNTDLVLSALDDDRVGGSLNGVGDCATGGTLAVGASYSCSYIQAVSGVDGDTVVNTVTVTATVPLDSDTTLTESDSFTVAIVAAPEPPPSILVTKNVSPEELEEPGGAVVYTIRVTNTSQATDPVTLTSLVDTVYGDLNGQGSCATGGVIASGATYECTLNESHTGVAGDTFANTVTAQVQDDEGETAQDSDDALVTILAEPLDPELTIEKTGTPGQVTEPGGDVTYGIRVVNTGNTDLVLSALDDDQVGGSLNGVGDCATGGTLAVGASYSCSYIQAVNGSFGDPAVVNTVTVTATVPADPDTTLTESDSFAVTILADPEPPSILVTKNVSPEELEEPGGAVVYTIRVTNTSQGTDPVTLTSLVDTVYGDLNGQGSCATGGVIASGATYECTLNESHTGVAGDTFANTVTAQAQDDEGETAQDSDDALVTIEAVQQPPAIEIFKTASVQSLPEPGGDVRYDIVIRNVGGEDLIIDDVTDSLLGGSISTVGTCGNVVGFALPIDAVYDCQVDVPFTNRSPSDPPIVNTVTVVADAADGSGQQVTAQDSATVTIDDVPSDIKVYKTARIADIQDPGAGSKLLEYRLTILNLSEVDVVTINSLQDIEQIEKASGTNPPESEASVTALPTLSGEPVCTLPFDLQPRGNTGDQLVCYFGRTVDGADVDEDDVVANTVIASGIDDDGQPVEDSDGTSVDVVANPLGSIELIKVAGVASVEEPGADVTFSLSAINTSEVDVTIDTLTDAVGSETPVAIATLDAGTDCIVPATIVPGDEVNCSFVRNVAGVAGDSVTNTVTASGADSGGNPVVATARATVAILPDTLELTVVKTITPNVATVGEDVTFDFTITNTSDVASLRITGFEDDLIGNLEGQGSCQTGAALAVGESYSCAVTGTVTEGLDGVHRNTVVVGADRVTPVTSSSRNRVGRQLPGQAVVAGSDIDALAPADVYGQDSAWSLVIPPLPPIPTPTAIPIGSGILGLLIVGVVALVRRRYPKIR